MRTEWFSGFEDFAARAPRKVKEEALGVGTKLVGLVVEEGAKKAIAVSPVGSDAEASRRVSAHSGKPQYGHLKDRFFVSATGRGAGGLVPAEQVGTVVARLKPGMGASVLNDAAHFNTVNRGRKRLATGRMGGSTQARRGISKPTVEHLNSVSSELEAKAIREQEAKG